MLPFRANKQCHTRQLAKSRAFCVFRSASFTSSTSFTSPISGFPYPLPSSVPCNSFVCHSYENCRVCTQNSHSGTHPPLRITFVFTHLRGLILQTLCFQIHACNGGCTSLCSNYKSWPQIVRGQPLSHNMLWSRRTKTEYPHRLVYPPLPTLELTPCVSPGLPAPLYLLFSYSYVEPILQALYFHIHPCNGGCTLLPGVSTGYRLLPIITYPQGFSASKKSKKMSQLRAVWRLFALLEEPGASGSAGSGISVRSVPGFSVKGLDRLQFFLRKSLIHCGKFLGNEGVEFAGHVIQFLLERIDARTLVIGWTPLIVQNSSVECRRFFADAFLTGDGASFRRGHDLLAHGFHFAGEFLQPLAEDGVCLQLCAALHQPGVYAVNAVDIEAHFPEQTVKTHRRVDFQFAIFDRELSARIEFQDKLRGVSLFAARHLHRVAAGHNSGALRRFKRSRGCGRNVRRLQAHGPLHAADAAAAVWRERVHQLALRIKNFQFHFSKNVTLALVIRNQRRVRRIGAGEHRASFRPAAICRKPLLRGLGLEENCLLRHNFRGQLAQRCDVVHDPDAAAMRGDHQIRFARVHNDVPDGHCGELVALVSCPVFAAIQ